MKKQDEITNPSSCMNRAHNEEMTFVLLGRDLAAPVAIRAWIAERIRLGKNTPDDAQIIEAEKCADGMGRRPRKKAVADDPNQDMLLLAVQGFVESRGGKLVVIGGVTILEWPQDNAGVFHVAIKCMGRKPTPPKKEQGNEPAEAITGRRRRSAAQR